MRPKPILFAGPSLVGLNADVTAEFDVRPPVRRGDIDQLAKNMAPSNVVVIIADGMFHDYPSVGHSEIRNAIRMGRQMWGVSSMGAIRAAELRTFGMIGYGCVYRHFASDPEFTDDEVALLHLGEPPYILVSEPLIHIRVFLDYVCSSGAIASTTQSKILSELKSLWFGDRTLSLLGDLLKRDALWPEERIEAELRSFQRFRIKNQDLDALLRARPWN